MFLFEWDLLGEIHSNSGCTKDTNFQLLVQNLSKIGQVVEAKQLSKDIGLETFRHYFRSLPKLNPLIDLHSFMSQCSFLHGRVDLLT